MIIRFAEHTYTKSCHDWVDLCRGPRVTISIVSIEGNDGRFGTVWEHEEKQVDPLTSTQLECIDDNNADLVYGLR